MQNKVYPGSMLRPETAAPCQPPSGWLPTISSYPLGMIKMRVDDPTQSRQSLPFSIHPVWAKPRRPPGHGGFVLSFVFTMAPTRPLAARCSTDPHDSQNGTTPTSSENPLPKFTQTHICKPVTHSCPPTVFLFRNCSGGAPRPRVPL